MKICNFDFIWINLIILSLCYADVNQVPISEDSPCANQPSGTFLSHPLGCQYFFYCSDGVQTTASCPTGMHFSSKNPPCDLISNANCVEIPTTVTIPTTVPTTTAPATTTTPTTPTTTTSTTTIPTTTTPTTTIPTSTTSTTILPTTTTPTTTPTIPSTTSAVTEDNIETQETTTDQEPSTSKPTTVTITSPIPVTETETSTTGTITTTIEPTTIEVTTIVQTTTIPPRDPSIEPGLNCPLVEDPDAVTFLSSNVNCSRYYICYHGQPIPMVCGDDLEWNPAANKCDIPENARCTVTNMPAIYPICPRDSVGLFPHPLDCELFLYCYHGYMTIQQCPFYFYWDAERETCELRNKAKCVSAGQRS